MHVLAAGIVWSKMLSYILAKNTTILHRNVVLTWAVVGTYQLPLSMSLVDTSTPTQLHDDLLLF